MDNFNNPLGKPTTYRKTADDTVNNSIVTVDDSELTGIPLIAGRYYKITIVALCDSSAVADFRLQVVTSQNVTYYGSRSYTSTAGVPSHGACGMNNGVNLDSVATSGGLGAGIIVPMIIDMIGMGTINCTLKVQFAQNTAEVSDTKLKAGSRVIVEEL